MEDPHDLIGHQCALRLDGYQGQFTEAGRAARALPFWSKGIQIMELCSPFMASA